MVELCEAEQEAGEAQGHLFGDVCEIELALLRWQHGRRLEGDARQRVDGRRVVAQVFRGERTLRVMICAVEPQHEGPVSERAVGRIAEFLCSSQCSFYVLPCCQ